MLDPRKNYFLDYWYEYLKKDENKLCLSDPENTYTRAQVENLSGRLYSYLKKQGVGTNDFVLIDLPRSSKFFIVMIAVAKAGAAYVAVESDLGKERKEFIKNDISCKLVINEELLESLDNEEYLEGFEPVSPHDAAFAIYTSGTTGTPKGVIHEYGNYGYLFISILDPNTGKLRENEDTRFLTIAPFNFVASVMIFTLLLYAGGCVFTPDYGIIKNGRKLVKYLFANKINEAFFAPSILKMIAPHLNPEMELIYTGSEPAINVSIPHGKLFNLYLMSEALFVVSQYPITEPMEVTPIGKSNEGIEATINKKGEVVIYNPFCRGYLHAEDNKAFKDGYYNTGDLAELDADGNFVLRGRSTDTIKINGNRVEPLEVEAAAREVLGGIPCAVKGFTRNDNAYICLYYVSKKDIDRADFTAKMEEKLPYYMIPSNIVKLDELPRTKLGKLNRKALKEPGSVSMTKYVAPTTNLQKKMCETFQNTLGIEKIGIDDDLFELGLNSMLAIEAITDLNLDEIETSDVYKARTIRNFEECYNEALSTYLTPEEKEMKGRKGAYRLYGVSANVHNLQENIGTTEINLATAWRFNHFISSERMKNALNTVMEASSTFKVGFSLDEEGEIIQKYDPSVYTPVEIEYMTEAEVEELRKTFVKPFRLLEGPAYRFRLIKTKRYTYLFMDMSHVLSDGMGMVALGEDIKNAYLGKPLQENYYFAFCFDQTRFYESVTAEQNKEYVREKLLKKKYGCAPVDPGDEVYSVMEDFETDISMRAVSKYIQERKISRGTLMYAAAVLSLAKANKNNSNVIEVDNSKRENNANQAGCRYVGLITATNLDKKMDIAGLYRHIERELVDSVSHEYNSTSIEEWLNGYNHFLLNDTSDVDKAQNRMKIIAKPVKLERPYDTIEGVPLVYTCLRVQEKKGKLGFRLEVDNSVMNKNARDEFMNDVISALNRLLKNDETVIQEYLN